MPIDPQLAADAVAAYGAVKAVNEAAKLPVVAPVVALVNEHVKGALPGLYAKLRGILSREQAAAVAGAEVEARLADVPLELRVEPAGVVVAGVVEALQTRADEPTLRALFSELLASACRGDRADGVHLAFVEVLRQLEPDEARLLATLASYPTLHAWATHVDHAHMHLTPASFTVALRPDDPLATSPRLDLMQANLLRLGLLAMQTRTAPDAAGYGEPRDLVTRATFTVTVFGRQLLAVCAPNGVPPVSEGPAAVAPREEV